MKTCSVCKEIKPLDDFHNQKENQDGKTYQCKICRRKRYKEYSQTNQAKIKLKARKRKHTSFFTKEYWDSKFEEQGGKCAICGTTDPGKISFCADHCHDTLEPRGILCRKCNSGIGLLKDDIELLKKAIEYLEYYKSQLDTK